MLIAAPILFAATNPVKLIKTKFVTLPRPNPIKAMNSPAMKMYGKTALMFSQKQVWIMVKSGPSNDMLSYRIDGIRNPKLLVRPGAILHILFVNADDDMKHDLRVAPYKPGMNVHVPPTLGVGTKELPPHGNKVFYAEWITLKMPKTKGEFEYLCTVKGHAPGGMFGYISVK